MSCITMLQNRHGVVPAIFGWMGGVVLLLPKLFLFVIVPVDYTCYHYHRSGMFDDTGTDFGS